MFDFIPRRYVFSLVGLSATTLSIALQTNLSLAIVYMVDQEHLKQFLDESSNECSIPDERAHNSSGFKEVTKGYLDWSPNMQGIAVGAQFAGGILGYIPGGRLAELYGGKATIISTLLLSSIFTAFLPLAAEFSIYLFIVCRMIIGIGASPVFPTVVFMIAKWIPTSEQSFISSFIMAGYGTGAFISYLTAGTLCSSKFLGGWPSVFYTGALSGIIWALWCYFAVYDSPETHPTISEKELKYIQANIPQQMKKVESIPWKSMATSIPFWALAIGSFGQFWILSFFATSVALYMGTILNLNSAQNGVLACLPNLTRAVVACVVGMIIDYSCRRRKIPTVFIRKGATLLNSVITSLGFTCIMFAGCDVTLSSVCFIIAGAFNDLCIFGVCLAANDMAPGFNGTLSGILSFLGSFPYILVPTLIGALTEHERSMVQWRYIYLTTIGVIAITTAIYLIFGTSEPQPWGTNSEETTPYPEEKIRDGKESALRTNSLPKVLVHEVTRF